MDNTSTSTSVMSPCTHLDSFRCNFMRAFVVVYPPILLVIGTIGNILCICVLTRKRMRNCSATVYLICLAVADLAVLYIALVREWLVYLVGIDIRKINNDTCRVQLWLQAGCFSANVWILVALTVDRLVSIKNPIFAKVHCTNRLAAMITVGLAVGAIIANMAWFAVERTETVYTDPAETPTMETNSSDSLTVASQMTIVMCEAGEGVFGVFLDNIYPPVMLLLVSILPLMIVAVSNVCIFVSLVNRARDIGRVHPTDSMTIHVGRSQQYSPRPNNRRSLPESGTSVHKKAIRRQHATDAGPTTSDVPDNDGNNHQSSQNRLSASSRSFTRMLFALSVFFILATLPMCLYLVLASYIFRSKTIDDSVNRKLFWICASFCFYSNSTFNFVVYCLSGSLFRETLRQLYVFRKIRQWYRGNAIQPRSSTIPNTSQNTTTST